MLTGKKAVLSYSESIPSVQRRQMRKHNACLQVRIAWGKLENNCSFVLPAEELGNIKSNRQIAKQKPVFYTHATKAGECIGT